MRMGGIIHAFYVFRPTSSNNIEVPLVVRYSHWVATDGSRVVVNE